MAQALYRKYRSQSLDEIVGQRHIIDVLGNALKKGHVNHAYLLTGPRGVGKTSIARILAYAINKLPYSTDTNLDIIEIDAASNNGVEDIRDLREKVSLAPVSATKKIYIIDEVHMLSKPAFNALLKTLEEPPEHVVFILATTEVHKLPDTILSRTQRFHFRLISNEDMAQHLANIAKKEKIKIDKDALTLIAERAGGSFRDGISLLDQIRSISEETITPSIIEDSLGLAPQKSVDELIKNIENHQLQDVVELVTKLENQGISPVVLSEQLTRKLRGKVVEQPEYIDLIDKLLEVGKSHEPQLKLLAIVARATSNGEKEPSKNIALSAHRPTISVKPPQKQAPEPKAQKKPEVENNQNIDWHEILEKMRTDSPPLYGILQKANVRCKGETVHITFAYKLHQKKVEKGRFRQMLTEFLHEKLGFIPTISTSVDDLPTKSKAVSKIAAIMGGGEEVNVSPS